MEASNIPVSMPRVNLKDTIEELLKFTLQSCTNGTLEIDLGLPKELCSRLLKPEPNDLSFPFHSDSSTGIFEGIPPYPLYKRLALALHESIASGTLFGTCNNITIIHQESPLKEKENEWQKLILEKGSELVLKTVKIELHVQEPFFSQLKDGLKTIEGRCALGNCSRIDSGSLILFNKCLLFEVQDIRSYSSFSEMMEAEGLSKVLPGVETIEQVWGLQGLLGLAHTTGSTPDALPPPTSTLLSSFVLPYKLNVEGSTLTHGARALAKHAHRSSSKIGDMVHGGREDGSKSHTWKTVIQRDGSTKQIGIASQGPLSLAFLDEALKDCLS
ncbi:RNA-binding ASCH domain protein [Prunus dulcis]|uniref:RNA-binding ASCH domain protein n=1 Tax=Prunus dulcis TaxID=3755 RepID=A0A4Y1QP70_PRUDU|nr:RNA-binding ASCH domain protein [Prunus dulcis]